MTARTGCVRGRLRPVVADQLVDLLHAELVELHDRGLGAVVISSCRDVRRSQGVSPLTGQGKGPAPATRSNVDKVLAASKSNHAFAFQRIAGVFPILETFGIAANVLVPMADQEVIGGNAGGT